MVQTMTDPREALLEEIQVYLELMLELAQRSECEDCSGTERAGLQRKLAVLQRQIDLIADQIGQVEAQMLCAVPA